MIRRLRVKFVCINMLIVVSMLLVIFGTVFTMTKNSLEQESIQMMEAIAGNPLQLVRPDNTRGDLNLPYFSLEVDSSGNLRSTGGGFFDLSDGGFLLELLEVVNASGEETGVVEAYRLRYLRRTSPMGQFVIFADMSSEYSTMENLVWTCLLIGGASLLMFLVISIALSWWAIRPVERAWEQQQQFVADASHELKTPLTVILTNLDLLEEQQGGVFVENIRVMSQKMKGLAEGLLELARVDNGIPREVMEPVDLSRLVGDAILPFEPLFFEKGLSLDASLEPEIAVCGSAQHLRQLVEILLDNAMKYAVPGTGAQVRLLRNGRKHCLLTVSNPGEDMTREELQSLFKRFYRRDQVRRMNGSYGLGLSIAEGIAERHGGRIWAESEQGVITFCLQLSTI